MDADVVDNVYVSLTVAAAEAGGGVAMATDDAADVDGQLCDGGQRAVDMTTGRAYSCDACPPSSYCHRLSTASACCWIGMMIFIPVRVRSIVSSMSVRLSVCLSACL